MHQTSDVQEFCSEWVDSKATHEPQPVCSTSSTIRKRGLITPLDSGGRGAGTETLQRANRRPHENGIAPARRTAPAPVNSDHPHAEGKHCPRVVKLHSIDVRLQYHISDRNNKVSLRHVRLRTWLNNGFSLLHMNPNRRSAPVATLQTTSYGCPSDTPVGINLG